MGVTEAEAEAELVDVLVAVASVEAGPSQCLSSQYTTSTDVKERKCVTYQWSLCGSQPTEAVGDGPGSWAKAAPARARTKRTGFMVVCR